MLTPALDPLFIAHNIGAGGRLQSEVVIDGLGGKDGRKAVREWLETVERAVAAHTNQAFDT